MSKKTLYLVDGSGFIFRAFHALPPLRREDGTPVGAVLGFCNMLLRLLDGFGSQHKDDAFAVIFDAGRKTFRNDIYPEYKANRGEPPEDLIPQFSIIREACDAFAVPSVELPGYEADDLIATYADMGKKDGYDVVIVSSDKDLMQLIDDDISMLDPIKYSPISYAEVEKKFGVTPDKVVEVQALAGDSTDNVPGVPSIGVKTAAQLINEYGNLEELLKRAEEIKQPKRRQVLIDHADDARISKKLVQLDHNSPVEAKIKDFGIKSPDKIKLHEFLRFQGLNSVIARVEKMAAQASPAPSEQKYEMVTTDKALDQWIKRCFDSGLMAIDCETDSLNAMQANVVGISLASSSGQACYIPFTHETDVKQLDAKAVFKKLQPLLTDPTVLKVGHNLKYDLLVMSPYNVEIAPYADTMLMSYCLDAGKGGHGMDELSERHLAHTPIKFSEVCGTGKSQITFDKVDLEKATDYAAEDSDITLQLYHKLQPRLAKEQVMTTYERVERPLVQVITDVEKAGVLVDGKMLEDLNKDFTKRLDVLEKGIYKLVGHEFNLASPKQLGEILFNEMGLTPLKKTKTGAYVTDADTLEKLAAQGHELPTRVIEWRGLAKLRSTYLEGLKAAINPKTGRIHTSFVMTGAATGRMASTDPNLQNIPIRTEDGRKIRQAFVAPKDHVLMSLDYSQIELRLLAHMGKIDKLAEAFRNGMDIHAATSAEMFGLKPEDVTPEIRRRAKAINFGIIYGISAFGLSQQLGIPQREAAQYIKTYLERYPGIQDYMEQQKAYAKEHGYVRNLFGRKCHIPGIHEKNPMVRQFSERQAINAPLQGTTADITKKAMIMAPKALKDAGLKAKMLLQVHDELLFEAPKSEAEATLKLLKQVMESVVELDVPLVVEGSIGNNWDEAH